MGTGNKDCHARREFCQWRAELAEAEGSGSWASGSGSEGGVKRKQVAGDTTDGNINGCWCFVRTSPAAVEIPYLSELSNTGGSHGARHPRKASILYDFY